MLIVLAVVSTVSLGAYESIVQFQYQSQVESASSNLLAILKDAQNKSRSGLLPVGNVAADFTETGLPVYSVVLNGNSYMLQRSDTLVSTGAETVDEETYVIDSAITVTPGSATVSFARLSGLPLVPVTYTLTKGAGTVSRSVIVHSAGLLTRQ